MLAICGRLSTYHSSSVQQRIIARDLDVLEGLFLLCALSIRFLLESVLFALGATMIRLVDWRGFELTLNCGSW